MRNRVLKLICNSRERFFASLRMTIILGIIFITNVSAFSQNKKFTDPDNFDVRLFRSIYNDSSAFKTAFFKHFDNTVLPTGLMLPIAAFFYGRIYNKTYDENSGYLLAVSEAANFIITYGLKESVKRPRPYAKLKNVRPRDLSTRDPYAFPSGHASTSFSISTMFALRYPKYPQTYIPMYLWSLIVTYGRPYLGMHYPSDLLAGALIGAGSSVLIYSLRKELLKLKNNVLKEDKPDDGSINGGVISIFAASIIVSDLLNTYILKSNKMRLSISRFSDYKPGINLSLNYLL